MFIPNHGPDDLTLGYWGAGQLKGAIVVESARRHLFKSTSAFDRSVRFVQVSGFNVVSLDSAGRFEAGTTTGKASFRLVAHNGVYHTVKVQVADYLHPTMPISFANSTWPALQEFSRVFPDPFLDLIEYVTAHDIDTDFRINDENQIINVQGEVQQVEPQLEQLLRGVLEPYPYIMWLFLGGKHGFNVILIRNRDDGFQDSHTFGYGASAETVNPLDPRPHWHYSDNRLIQ